MKFKAYILPYWREVIAPTIKSGKKVLISAHGNSLRGLVKDLDNITDDELIYELDNDLKPLKHYYLGDPKEIEKAIKAVKDQSKKMP